MEKIYTFVKKHAILASVLSLTLFSSGAFSQPICGGIIENFNSTGGTTAGFTGDFSYNAAGQNLIRRNVIGTAVYVITSPTYKLPATESSVGYGFILDGTEKVSRVEVVLMYISTLTSQLTTIFITQFVPSYGASSSATVCRAVATSDLPGFPTSGQYRFRIELTTSTGSGLATQTMTFDDFRTNGTLSLFPLPVTFIGFDARKVSAGVQLTWKVGGEENVARYEVERSDDGRNFSKIGTVNKSGIGTYTYLDAATLGASVYYRIKNVDNDGKLKYSSIARFKNGRSEIVIKAFPQPVKGQLTIQHPMLSGNGLISISTADGRVVKSMKPSVGSMQTYVDMSGLQAGLYVIRFDAGDGNTETMKIVKQ